MSTLKKMFGKDRYIPRGKKEQWDRTINLSKINDYYDTVHPDEKNISYTGGKNDDYHTLDRSSDSIDNKVLGAKGLVTLFGVPSAASLASYALENGDKRAAQKAALIAGATAGAVGGIHGAGRLAKRYKYTKPRHIDEDQRQRGIDANIKNRADKLQKELDERWASPDDCSLEKTASLKNLSKKLYKSDSKLKDVAFGTYKKGPYQGDNKFNVAYGKRAVKKHYDKVFDKHTNLNPEDLYYDKAFDKRTQYGKENLRGIKNDYDDAFVEAAARPVALAAGTGAVIYGGKKLLDRYNKRQAEKKEKNYYV